jgi:hypothetical protein
MSAVSESLVVLFWLGFLVIGIAILVTLFRNRTLQLWVKALLLLLVIALPILGILVCIGVWVGTRSRNREAEGNEEGPTAPATDERLPARRLPFPPPETQARD